MKSILLTIAVILLAAPPACRKQAVTYHKWQPIELEFTGPASDGQGMPNPFAIRADITFVSPAGRKYSVPAFFDGDGKGNPGGTVWKVRFSADQTGIWKYISESSVKELNGIKGTFRVSGPDPDAGDFYRWGRLEAAGTPQNGIRYLKFREGPFWLKAGCDDPENFLGKLESYNTIAERLAAIDYLSSRGINSLYLITHNIGGDGRDVWPWLGDEEKTARSNGSGEVRFDIARLEEWREVFDYMQKKGIVVYIILEDDSAWKEYDHERYYREIIARFSYLPAVIFNLNEEYNENYSIDEALTLAGLFKEIDPFDHPFGIHNIREPDDKYILSSHVDFTSIQTGNDRTGEGPSPSDYHRLVTGWLDRCKELKTRTLMVGIDEGRPEGDRKAWWSTYISGGVWEAHVKGPYDRPMESWDSTWTQLGGTRSFMESIPFHEMYPDKATVKNGNAFCLSKTGSYYALYLPEGGRIAIDLPAGSKYRAEWWDPDNGIDGAFRDGENIDRGITDLNPPGKGDWALRISRILNQVSF